LRSVNWFFLFFLAAFLGIGAGYVATLILRPTLLPPVLRPGALREPTTILFLGTDVVYTKERRRTKADLDAFTGRSDTILVARLDPIRNTVTVLSIPRDTSIHISGHGNQKINAANAIGGPLFARDVISSFLGIPIDHYVVLNVRGLVELVDKLGGVTVEIPKRMRYMDWTAKLKIDLEPGVHTLTGNQAMGFVRFRHDGLGDIGRVQRQEIFLRAVLDKALKPQSWALIPELIQIGRQYVATDLNDADLMSIAGFVRAVPRSNQQLAMLPGKFSGTGDWEVDQQDVTEMVAKLNGATLPAAVKPEIRIAIENASSDPELGQKLRRLLRAKGYEEVSVLRQPDIRGPRATTRIIAQRANADEALMVKQDLGNVGEVLSASIGDIESRVTVVAGEDLVSLVTAQQD
jgi:LCP family protein required for cell wall assembly